ncbi:hypothetical protein BDQ17DRAFT_1380231 [Cyathus striatus]|nr:hypothetical protein BDQ17DRAFT_1380231 [Cyathus striatus]
MSKVEYRADVGVDYSSPLLPAVNSSSMAISLDGGTSEPVQVFPGLSPNAKWSKSGLANNTHTLQISLGSEGLGDL